MNESKRRLKKVLDIDFIAAFIVAFISGMALCGWHWDFVLPFAIALFGMWYIRLWVKRWRLEELMENRVMTDAEMTAMEITHRIKAFSMSNPELSDEIVEVLKEHGYEPILLKFKHWQYIAATKTQKKDLKKRLDAKQEEKMEELIQLAEFRKIVEEDLKNGGIAERRRINKASC